VRAALLRGARVLEELDDVEEVEEFDERWESGSRFCVMGSREMSSDVLDAAEEDEKGVRPRTGVRIARVMSAAKVMTMRIR
jgi:hypothetical protein